MTNHVDIGRCNRRVAFVKNKTKNPLYCSQLHSFQSLSKALADVGQVLWYQILAAGLSKDLIHSVSTAAKVLN